MNQVRFNNVSVVRFKKEDKRFEIVCYNTKVLLWRNNTKADIDEVLQTRTIFTNISKGQAAKNEDLIIRFGDSDEISKYKGAFEFPLEYSEESLIL